LQTFIGQHGTVQIEALYEDPFTRISTDGLDGVFDDKTAEELITLIETFNNN